jgi:hypothetical protein
MRDPYLEGAEQTFVYAHHCTSVVKLAAIVGGAEQRHQLSFGEEFVAIFHYLMGAADQVHVMFLQEPRDDIGSKCERDSTIIFTPASDVLVGV